MIPITCSREFERTRHDLLAPFNFVEATDLDNSGTTKIIAANTVAHTGSDGVYDYPSSMESRRSVNLASGFSSVNGLTVEDLNSDGTKRSPRLLALAIFTLGMGRAGNCEISDKEQMARS